MVTGSLMGFFKGGRFRWAPLMPIEWEEKDAKWMI
jgi:hypothetical protein